MTEPPTEIAEVEEAESSSPEEGLIEIRHSLWLGRGEVGDLAVEDNGGRWLTYTERMSTEEFQRTSNPVAPEARAEEEDEQRNDFVDASGEPWRPRHLGVRFRPRIARTNEHHGWDPESAEVRRLDAWYEPESRRVFRDTSYPWSTVGRIRGEAKDPFPGEGGTGVLVGPRHVLTASHVAWYPDGTPNSMRFHPAYYDGISPFGSARVTAIRYYEPKVVRHISKTNEWNDFAVLILDSRLGDICGWMGSKRFARGWSGSKSWAHVGYPGRFKLASHVPTYESGFSVHLPTEYDEQRSALDHLADTGAGHSGGPIFAYWPFEGESRPYTVGVHSNGPLGDDPYPPSYPNQAAAGQRHVDLILSSRDVHP